MSTPAAKQPSPQLFFQTINAHQQTEALKAAIELEVFTAIGEGNTSAADIGKRCGASEKGARVLCDFLTIMGMLTKENENYSLTLDSSVFLDKRSPAYFGGATEFLCSEMLMAGLRDVAGAVRRGGTTMPSDGTVGPDNPVWVKFARGMAPMMAMPSEMIAKLVDTSADRKIRVLDIAAGHGLFGLAFAANNPQAEIVALDWPAVLEVAAHPGWHRCVQQQPAGLRLVDAERVPELVAVEVGRFGGLLHGHAELDHVQEELEQVLVLGVAALDRK